MREYWVLDPLRREAEFLALDESGRFEALPIRDGIVRSRAMAGLWLEVEWLWREPLPMLRDVRPAWGI